MLTDSYMANEETFPTCGYYLYDTVQDYTFQIELFLTQGGFFVLLIFGWIISIIYHFFFTFLPFIFNVVV